MPALNEWPHLWLPSATAPKAPVLLALHGTGGDEEQFAFLAEALGGSYSLLLPRGRSRDEGMNRWFRRLREGVFDLEDLARRSAELEQFLGEAATTYRFANDQMVWLGYSNGANIAGSMLLRGQTCPAKAALLHPMVPFYPDPVPSLEGLSLLITQGEADPTLPSGHAEAVAALYAKTGATLSQFTHGYGHSITPAEVEHVIRWLIAT